MPIFFFLMLRRQNCPCLPSEKSSQIRFSLPRPALLIPYPYPPRPVTSPATPPSWHLSDWASSPPPSSWLVPRAVGTALGSAFLLTWQKCSLLPSGSQQGEYLCTVLSQPQTLLLSFGLLGWCCNIITHILSPPPQPGVSKVSHSGLVCLPCIAFQIGTCSEFHVLYLPPPCLRVFLIDRVLADYRSVGAVGIFNGVILCWGAP